MAHLFEAWISLYNIHSILFLKLSIITPDFLRQIRREAIRRRAWFKVLDGLERGIVNLTIGYVDEVRSFTLARSIVGILKKIRDGLKSVFERRHEEYGLAKAVEMVSIAISFGSSCAMSWLRDERFSRWLTLHDLYSPFGVSGR
jgi:hypothetical protein